MSLIYGTLLGVAASLLSWWIISRLLTPRLAISAEISKLPAKDFGPWRYRVKVLNCTRRKRPAVEVKMTASLRTYGVSGESWSNYPIPIGHTGTMDMIDESATPRLQLHEMKGYHRRLLAEALKRKSDAAIPDDDEGFPLLTLEQIMSAGEDSEIRVVISAAHPYTGSRRAVVGRYNALQVIRGQFRRDGLQVVRDDARCVHPAA